MNNELTHNPGRFDEVIHIIDNARSRAMKAVNAELIQMYWEIVSYVSGRAVSYTHLVIAQIRAGCTERDGAKKLHSHQTILRKNLLLLSDKINTVDFKEIQQRLMRTAVAKEMFLEVVSYRFESEKHNIPVNAAIAKANSMMHDMEIEILSNMVKSGSLDTDRMLVVDGPLQFLRQDTGKAEFSDLFYNVIGVSKSFNPMLPASGKSKRGGTQIGAELLKLEYGERTPVFMKENDRGRRFGVWYLRIRPKNRVSNPLEGIIKIEKMALEDYYDSGIPTDIIDTISLSLLNECSPTCYGRDERWASHLYPVYLTETLIKSTFESDLVFINNFKRDFK